MYDLVSLGSFCVPTARRMRLSAPCYLSLRMARCYRSEAYGGVNVKLQHLDVDIGPRGGETPEPCRDLWPPMCHSTFVWQAINDKSARSFLISLHPSCRTRYVLTIRASRRIALMYGNPSQGQPAPG